jgi:hypothetical protein
MRVALRLVSPALDELQEGQPRLVLQRPRERHGLPRQGGGEESFSVDGGEDGAARQPT